MNVKKLLGEFLLTFVIAFVAAVIVTFVWNLIFHGRAAAEWETAFRLALILGIVIPLTKGSLKVKETAG